MSPRRRISRQTSNPSTFGQHQVENDEIRIVPGVAVEGLVAIVRGNDREPVLLEVKANEIDDVALVVDDQNRLHRRARSAWEHGGGIAPEDTP